MFLSRDIVKQQTEHQIHLMKLAQNVDIPKPYVFEIADMSNYSESDLDEWLSAVEEGRTIYVITSSELPFTKKQIIEKFKKVKEDRKNELKNDLKNDLKKPYHISKINGDHSWAPVSGKYVLYVGSKETGIKRRLMEHLGLIDKKSRTTYSLYLKDWWTWLIPIQVSIWVFDKEMSHEILQILEDSLWDALKPIFGKRGATFNKKANGVI